MGKIKITNIATGAERFVSAEDAEAVRKSKYTAKKYKIEDKVEKPSEPIAKIEEAKVEEVKSSAKSKK